MCSTLYGLSVGTTEIFRHTDGVDKSVYRWWVVIEDMHHEGIV